MPLPPAGDEEAIVFSGNMEYHPNVTAVRFFRQEVWPRLRERWPNLVWRLVGKNPGAVERYTAGDARIEVAGPVVDAVCEIARSRVAVVPLLTGSGTRLKILEAWAGGTARRVHHDRCGRAAGAARRDRPACRRRGGVCRGSNTAVNVHGSQAEARQCWQIVAGEGVYMGNCLEKVRLLTQPGVILVRYTGNR